MPQGRPLTVSLCPVPISELGLLCVCVFVCELPFLQVDSDAGDGLIYLINLGVEHWSLVCSL